MNKKMFYSTLGKLKVWQQRLSTYVGMVNFLMIFYLYIIESPMGLKWYHWFVIIVVGVTTLVFTDTRYIMPHALGYTFEKNPRMTELTELIKENRSLILENRRIQARNYELLKELRKNE